MACILRSPNLCAITSGIFRCPRTGRSPRPTRPYCEYNAFSCLTYSLTNDHVSRITCSPGNFVISKHFFDVVDVITKECRLVRGKRMEGWDFRRNAGTMWVHLFNCVSMAQPLFSMGLYYLILCLYSPYRKRLSVLFVIDFHSKGSIGADGASGTPGRQGELVSIITMATTL